MHLQHIASSNSSHSRDSAPEPASLLQRLRRETRPEHEALENDLALTGPGLSRDYYCLVLQAFYGFYRPFEDSLRRAAAPFPNPVFHSRYKVAALEADLASFDVAPDRLPVCTNLPKLTDESRIWGALYVIEGSTLGGQLIAREIEGRLGLRDGNGYRFFQGYGSATGSRWKEFGAALTLASTELPPDAVVAGAADTFRLLHQWLRTAGVCRSERPGIVEAPGS